MFQDLSFVNMREITPEALKPGNKILLTLSSLTKFELTVIDSERIRTEGVTYFFRYQVDGEGRTILLLSHFKAQVT